MKLTRNGIKEREAWKKAGIDLPGYDVEAVTEKAKKEPGWVHFGIGNIFRVFIGGIADGLLEEGVLDRGKVVEIKLLPLTKSFTHVVKEVALRCLLSLCLKNIFRQK